jgi:membrane-bound lytic murein transglycosylase D
MHRAGIWQLTHFQAVLNGAQIDKLVDERFHPIKSTRFAVNQLKHDFEIYNNNNLAVVALICGNTEVKNALAEAGENATWNEINELLPNYFQETVAAFQAMTVFLKTNKFIRNDEFAINKPDTIFPDKQIHFEQLVKISGLTITDLKFLNPQFKHSIIPAGENTAEVALPAGTKNEFLAIQDSIFEIEDSTLFQIAEQRIEYPPEPNRSFIGQAAKDIEIDGKTRIEYMLQTGDVLGIIAEKFDVSVSDLKYWNNIYNERRIQAGQKISVFVPDEKAAFYAEMTAPTGGKEKTVVDYSKIPANRKKVQHIVQNGESPFVIAKKYDGVTPEAILQWNHIGNARKIQIGQKLILYIPK